MNTMKSRKSKTVYIETAGLPMTFISYIHGIAPSIHYRPLLYVCMTLLQHHQQQHIQIIKENKTKQEVETRTPN